MYTTKQQKKSDSRQIDTNEIQRSRKMLGINNMCSSLLLFHNNTIQRKIITNTRNGRIVYCTTLDTCTHFASEEEAQAYENIISSNNDLYIQARGAKEAEEKIRGVQKNTQKHEYLYHALPNSHATIESIKKEGLLCKKMRDNKHIISIGITVINPTRNFQIHDIYANHFAYSGEGAISMITSNSSNRDFYVLRIKVDKIDANLMLYRNTEAQYYSSVPPDLIEIEIGNQENWKTLSTNESTYYKHTTDYSDESSSEESSSDW